MDDQEIEAAFDRVFDQAIVFHAFTEQMRDYDVFVHVMASPSSGIPPHHLRFRFTHCVDSHVTTRVRDDVWPRSLDDFLLDVEVANATDHQGYVWGVNWQEVYPGMSLVADSPSRRSRRSGPATRFPAAARGHRGERAPHRARVFAT